MYSEYDLAYTIKIKKTQKVMKNQVNEIEYMLFYKF